jgi:hypothetical protein
LEHTTQYARLPAGTLLKKAYKSPNPALNVYRRQEDVACDIVYSDVPAIQDGSTAAVIFVGVNTQVTDVYGIKTDKQLVNTLQDNIIQRGAPLKPLVTVAKPLLATKSLISCAPSVLIIGRVNLTNSIRTLLSDAIKLLRIGLIAFLIELEHLQKHGYLHFNMCVSY